MEPTVQELMTRARELCPPRSRDTYAAGFQRLEEAFGDRAISEITTSELSALRDQVKHDVGVRTVTNAGQRGRRLRSYDPAAHGHGAAENLVRSMRFFFRMAVEDGLVAQSPAHRVAIPSRPPAPERPLTSEELVDIWAVARDTGDDPELDCLLLDLLRHTAARRGGLVALRLGGLDEHRLTVLLSEKRGAVREQPLSVNMIERVRRHAFDRGARTPADPALRYRNGQPLSTRRFDNLFDRVDEHTTWAQPLDVGAHWIRHTTLADVANTSGIRVAEAFAGHTDSSLGTIGRYTKVPFEDVVAAYELLFGPRS